MLEKLKNAKLDVLPYLEITMKPADVRPITVVMMETVGDIKISVGSADDMAEVIGALGMVRAACLALLNVRLMKEMNDAGIAPAVVVGDDPPPF